MTTIRRIDYDGSNQPIYIGEAPPGALAAAAKWRIRRLTWTGTNMTLEEWAEGNDNFRQVWNNRASLSYL